MTRHLSVRPTLSWKRRHAIAKASRITRFRRLLHESLETRTLLDADGFEGGPFHLPPQFHLFDEAGYLTGPAEGAPLDIAIAYLHERAGDLGLTSEDLAEVLVTDNYTDADTGITHIYLRQSVAGMEVAQADLNVHLTALGEVISVGGGFVPGLGDLVEDGTVPLVPAITAEQAIELAATNLGFVIDVDGSAAGPDGQGGWSVPAFSLDEISAELQFAAAPYNGAALSWQLIVRTPDNQHWYDIHVDATSGDIVSLSDWASHASYTVLPIPVESPNHGPFQTVVDPHLAAANASPFGWHDTNGIAGAESTLTIGNNVDAHLDRDGNNVADVTPPRPNGGASLDFNFPFNSALSPLDNANPAVTNLFYWNNILHDVHYQYGFTSVAGNFQTNTYGLGGLGNDAVQADAQDNANFGSVNNANFFTPPDGQVPRMQMFEFTNTVPRRDSDMDPGIIIHEYGHGVSNRLTGGPANASALVALQSGGMGEGWSDWWALMLTQQSAAETTLGRGMGTYVLGQPTNGPGIRQFKYDFDIANQPFETFLNFGIGVGQSTQVHNVGTRWAAALWDLTHLLIQKYGFATNLYNSTSTAGNIRALHLVMNGLKLQPANPSFIQARDAILLADTNLHGSANHLEIWTAFARRGLGFGASTPSSSSSTLTTSFVIPPGLAGLVINSSTPANSSIVTVQPTSFVINFSAAVNPASVQPADLLVNGIPANGVALSNGNQTATFSYLSTPVTAQGVQTMSIAPNVINRASDNDGNDPFSATFRYDATLLTVVSTNPPIGGTFTLPSPLTYDVNFNEPVTPGSVQTTDLVLSGIAGASVTAVTVLAGNQTARFTIGGVASEGSLTASIAAGAISDSFGNPGAAFSGSYQTDFGAVPYPVPLTAKAPLGSLIYDPSVSGVISFPGDVDQFSLNIDPGQTITVLVDPAGTADTPLYGGVGNGAGAAAGQLLLINQTTAASTIVGDPVTPGGLTGLVYDPSGGFFLGSTINASNSSLVRINPTTGALLATVGPIVELPAGGQLAIGDLAIHPITNVLYGITSNSGGEIGGRLFTINKANGQATFVGNTGAGAGGGISFAPDGSLYQTAYNNNFDFFSLNKISPATAARISTVPLSTYFDGLAIRPSDGAFFAAQGGSGTTIFTINSTTGVATTIGNTSSSTSDLAFIPASGIAPIVELRDPANVLLGSASAGPALNALIQTVDTTTGGNYTIAVSGPGASVGGYTVQVVLNAALEAEGVIAGANNGTQATAQDINASFIDLGAPSQDAERGAVLGSVQASGTLIANGSFETGTFANWVTATTGAPFRPWAVNGAGVGGGFNMLTTAPQDGTFVAWNGFDGSGPMEFTMRQDVTLPAGPVSLSWKDRLQWNFFTPNAQPRSYFVEVRNPATNALLGTLYSFSTGTTPVNVAQNTGWLTHSADLTPFAGSTVRLQFREVIPQAGTGPGQAEFDAISIATTSDTDWYKFTLSAGETSTLALKALTGLGSSLGLAIFDSSGLPVPASIATAANLDRVGTFTAGASGEYFARVTTASGAVSYSLVATQGAAFDTELNNTLATAQNISAVQGALGSTAGSATNVTIAFTELTPRPVNGVSLNGVTFGFTIGGVASTDATFGGAGPGATAFTTPPQLEGNSAGALEMTFTTATPTLSFGVVLSTGGVVPNGATVQLFDAANSLFSTVVVALAPQPGFPFAENLFVYAGATAVKRARVTFNSAAALRFVMDNVAFQIPSIDEDWYSINVGSGAGPLHLQTYTPADGPGQFVNTLNSRIELFNPAGALVASGTVLPDGRNEIIQHVAAGPGLYRVRVTAQGGTSGEYFLRKNFSPAVAAQVTSPINEGDAALLTGTINDELTDSHTVVITWGPAEGSTTLNLPPGVLTFSTSHLYADDNPTGTSSDTYPITVTVTDNHGAVGTVGGGPVLSPPTELVVNGGFETGNFSGWNVSTNPPVGNWFINNGTFDPDGPGVPLAPISGNFDAVTSQNGPSLHLLSEPIVVPSGIQSATFSWSDRIQNHATVFSDPNQEFRVRILNSTGGLIQEVFSTNPGDPLQQLGPNNRSFNVTSLLQSLAGQTIHVSFQTENNLFFFNTSIDNVSLQVVTSGSPPAPSSLIFSTHNDGTRLGTINPATGAGTDIGPFGTSQTWAAAFDTDGTLYTLINGLTGNPILARVNQATGAVTPIGPGVGTPMITLEVAADGTMYGIGAGDRILYRINKTLGTATPIGNTGIDFTMDTAFNSAGVLYATTMNRLWTVNTTTGASTFLGTISGPQSHLMGLMFDASDNLLATDYVPNAPLYRINLTTMTATSVGLTGFFLPHGGDIFVSSVPPAGLEVTVNNVAPSITSLIGASAINENDTATVSGTFFDPGLLDTHTVVITWGAGEGSTTLQTADLVNQGGGVWSFSASHQYLDDNPTGTASDTYAIGVLVTDDDGGSDSSDMPITVSSDIFSTHSDGTRLGTIDPATGVGTDIGPFGTSQTWAAAFDTDGTLYTLVNGLTGNAILARVNQTTGAVTPIGPGVGTAMITLEVAADGTMYGIGAGDRILYRINKTLGTATPIGNTGINFVMDTAFSPTGTLYATTDNMLWTVNLATGASTLLGTINGPQSHLMGLMFDGNGTLFATDYVPNSPLYRINLATMTATAVGLTGFNFPHGGDIFVSSAPAPGLEVTVNNVAPALTSLNAPVINEGQTATVTGRFFDPGLPDTHTVVISWGAGEGSTTLTTAGPNPPSSSLTHLGGGVWSFTASHEYQDDHPSGTASDTYAIGVVVTDDDTGSDSDATTVTVNNVAPTITSVSAPSAINEDDTAIVSGVFFDPGLLDTHTVVITWGAGEGSTTLQASDLVNEGGGVWSFTASHQYQDDNPSGTASDPYTIGVLVTDDDTGSDAAAATLTVNNVVPTITSLGSDTIDENDTATISGTFFDPGLLDTHTVVITWGAGEGSTTLPASALVDQGGGVWSFSASHQYLDDNPTGTDSDVYPISVTVTDDDTGADSDSTSVTVNNVAAEVSAIDGPDPSPGVLGQTLFFSAAFTDVGTQDTHTAVWDWGDGSNSAGVVTEASGSGGVTGSHVYSATGTYTVTLTVTDDDTGATSVVKTFTIVTVALQTDACDPTKTQLAVGGTTGNDVIVFSPVGNAGDIEVTINGVSQGVFAPTGRILAFGQSGDDDIQVAGSIANAAWLYGDTGNDRLKGGAGVGVLLGGSGDDQLFGGSGQDLLIGGLGADRLVGNSGEDVLIGGSTAYDASDHALCAILDEWTSGRDYDTRAANIQGTGAGPRLNENYFLKSTGADATVFDDGAEDRLTGSTGIDWFFAGLGDIVTNQSDDELLG